MKHNIGETLFSVLALSLPPSFSGRGQHIGLWVNIGGRFQSCTNKNVNVKLVTVIYVELWVCGCVYAGGNKYSEIEKRH